MTAATTGLEVRTTVPARLALTYRLAGLAVAMLLPAAFWVAIAAGLAHAAGATISTPALFVTGVAIALFLGAVCAPIMLKA
jgi:hypothetical protein